jgi:hydroxymethylpyrimidine/phosphomethylpyrimidine kinase
MDRGDPAAMTARTPIALTIAGSDSGAGAGVQADLRTFAALGVYGASVVTALTAQNTRGVRAIHLAPPEMVAAQIGAVLEDFSVAAIKIGMLGSAEIVGVVAERLRLPSPQPSPAKPVERRASLDALFGRGGEPLLPPAGEGGRAKRGRMRAFVVYDPVMAASSGEALSGAGFVEAIRTKLLPLVDCLTPNLAEAAALLAEPRAPSEDDMARQGRTLLELGPRAVLMKGGHLQGGEAVDLLVTADSVHRFAAPRIASKNLHGTGCTLSSAIAAFIVLGMALPEAVAAARAFVREAIKAGRDVMLGSGPGPLIQTKLRAPA